MATLKLKSYPKKPKAKASAAVLENYIARCKAIDKENAEKRKEVQKRENLKKQVAKIGKAK